MEFAFILLLFYTIALNITNKNQNKTDVYEYGFLHDSNLYSATLT